MVAVAAVDDVVASLAAGASVVAAVADWAQADLPQAEELSQPCNHS